MKRKTLLPTLVWPLAAMLLFSGFLWVERIGLQSRPQIISGFLPSSAVNPKADALPKECLLIYDGTESADYYSNIEYVLDNMSVGYQLCDASREKPGDLTRYRTVLLALSDLDLLNTAMLDILQWVDQGGNLLIGYTPYPNSTFSAISEKLGVIDSYYDYYVQTKARLLTDLLPGGYGQEYTWGENNRYGLGVQLTQDCTVYMEAVNEQGSVPMLWERGYGNGKILVNNNDAFAARDARGLLAAAYSLLDTSFAYPVINASVFYLDDFPAPIPEGHNAFIDRFYDGMDVGTFYTSVWLADVLKWSQTYHLRYTANMIETYSNAVQQPLVRPKTTDQYRYLGNLLIQDGHEIALHGYNHMPLVLPGFDYMGLFDTYRPWASTEDIQAALGEAQQYANTVFPGLQLKTYIAPSNIMNEDTRRIIHATTPQINTISCVYMPGELAYLQEFGVGKDGIVDLPRIISGCKLSNDDRWLALSELSFHYVNSHFMHPDDVLDPDRGAELGWPTLRQNMENYLQWLYGAAKGLRNLTAQQGAMAVQRYVNLSVRRQVSAESLKLDIGGLYDEAWLLVRVNRGTPAKVTGGSIQPVSGTLYLLHATSAHVEIAIEGGN